MGKILAVLAASAVVAGGATYALFSYANPYKCHGHAATCEVATTGGCCADAAHDACPTAEVVPDSGMAAAGPVALFATSAASAEGGCCSVKAKATARHACCSDLEAAAPAPAIAAVVGPAAAR